MSDTIPATKRSGFRDITIPADAVQEVLILFMLVCLGAVIGVLIAWPVAGEE